MLTNHTSMTGPNIRPTAAVPRDCTVNRANSTASASGTT